jgi:hypothetical protein
MTNWKSMGFAASLIAFSAVDARAECVFSPFEFFPDRNDVVHVGVESNGKGLCDISFREDRAIASPTSARTASPRTASSRRPADTITLTRRCLNSRAGINSWSAPAPSSASARVARP